MQNVLSDQELARALSYDLKIAILGGKKFYRRKLSSGSGRFSGGKFQHFSGGKIEIFSAGKFNILQGENIFPLTLQGKIFSPYILKGKIFPPYFYRGKYSPLTFTGENIFRGKYFFRLFSR